MVMTQRASTCLSLLALLSSFPLSQGGASHSGGSSLIAAGGGTAAVSKILDEFFKKQEIAGRTPAWKKEAQTLISLVQDMQDQSPEVMERVMVEVDSIIALLDADVVITKDEQVQESGKMNAKKEDVEAKLRGLRLALTKVKDFSASSQECRDNVTSQNTSFYQECTDSDHDPYRGFSNSHSLLEVESTSCPQVCGVPSTRDFELTDAAKAPDTCNFEAGETAKECVARLWAKVNLTRTNLTNKYNAWDHQKRLCEEHQERCRGCNPKWEKMIDKKFVCDMDKNTLYDKYCDLQRAQKAFCLKNESLYTTWQDVKTTQTARQQEYKDLKFLKCVFQYFRTHETFDDTTISQCPYSTPQEYYEDTQASVGVGKIVLPEVGDGRAVDTTDVPDCFGTVAHASGTTLFDMTGLITELTRDGLGTTVSISDKIYSPDAQAGSTVCQALSTI